MNFFKMFLQMAPAIIGLVKQVEDVVPGSGNGKAKLDMVLHAVNTGVAASAEVSKAVEGHDLNAAVSTLVSGTVSTLNAVGVFKK